MTTTRIGGPLLFFSLLVAGCDSAGFGQGTSGLGPSKLAAAIAAYCPSGSNVVSGGDGADLLLGTAANDCLLGFGGDDTLEGLEGDDVLVGGPGDDILRGGQGRDSLRGQAGNDLLEGGDGPDKLSAGIGDDFLDGGGGNDTLTGEAGLDELHGGDGDDVLSGGDGDDSIDGAAGSDRAFGGAGDDVVSLGVGADRGSGGAGNDILAGGDGIDVLNGEAGRDLIDGGPSTDQIDGGPDTDQCDEPAALNCESTDGGSACASDADCAVGRCALPAGLCVLCLADSECADGTCDPAAGCGCGNGILDALEECDDGGTDPGDGCSATCMIEPSGITFNQLDWVSSDKLSTLTHSLWGAVTITYPRNDVRPKFLNVVVQAQPPVVPPAWVIENFPIFPEGEDPLQSDQLFFDLTELGLAEGDALTGLCFVVTLEGEEAASLPTAPIACGPATPEVYEFGDHPLHGATAGPPKAGKPAPLKFKKGTKVTQLGKNRPKTEYEGVQEGANQCMGGAMARSLAWLHKAYRLGPPKSAQAFFGQLLGAGVTVPAGPSETVPAAEGRRLAAKKNFTDTMMGGRVVTKVWDSGSAVDSPAGVGETGGDLAPWLTAEWETEAVEIAFQSPPDSAHIVTLVGLKVDDAGNFIGRYRDDGSQGDANGGDRVPKSVIMARGSDGNYYFGNTSYKIHFAISESVTPPPP
ncbi:MAG: hypothetical protein HY791_12440 [Deltaproteobacteria bacterium]|nr:hypothetical protein [Deltaproteobacteria bacterium]